MVTGQKRTFATLKNITDTDKVLWLHCASLGEFEQGLPFVKKFLEIFPDYKLLLSFFSPSGFEVQKNNPLANWVVYLPLDSARNAQKFIVLTRPNIAVFVKYDFWYHYLKTLQKNDIPTFLISAIFRPQQWFFKPYGKIGVEMLRCFTHIFVQDDRSKKILKNIGITAVNITGDTRFERALEITATAPKYDWLQQFKGEKKLLVMGSTWETEENQLLQIIDKAIALGYQILIAPHEICPQKTNALQKILRKKNITYTTFTKKNNALITATKVFILDAYGLLAGVYGFADVAYVGGGYTKDGIHNVLEPAAFGKPIVIGSNYQKFKEARELVKLGGILVTDATHGFLSTLQKMTDPAFRKKTGNICKKYVLHHQGATVKILETISAKTTL